MSQEVAQARRHRLEEPDVDDRRGQVDVAHALAADAAVRDLDAAPVADDALVLHALVLAAEALPVALGTEDPLAEQAVLLRPVGAVVDGLGLLDLAERPAIGCRWGWPEVILTAAVVVDACRRRFLGHRQMASPGEPRVIRHLDHRRLDRLGLATTSTIAGQRARRSRGCRR